MTNHQEDTVDALANLETATAADRATMATLIDTISQLSSDLTSKGKTNLVPVRQPAPLEQTFGERCELDHFRGCGRRKDYRGWCDRIMGWPEHPLLPHSRTQVSPPQIQVS